MGFWNHMGQLGERVCFYFDLYAPLFGSEHKKEHDHKILKATISGAIVPCHALMLCFH